MTVCSCRRSWTVHQLCGRPTSEAVKLNRKVIELISLLAQELIDFLVVITFCELHVHLALVVGNLLILAVLKPFFGFFCQDGRNLLFVQFVMLFWCTQVYTSSLAADEAVSNNCF